MNSILKFSEAKLREHDQEIKKLIEQLTHSEYPLNKMQLLTEVQVCALLGVSERTMRTYRQRNYFHFIKLEGRILYLKHILLQDLLRLNLHELKIKK